MAVDEKARAGLTLLSHLLEQVIHLHGNHQHHAVVRPQLEALRQNLASDAPAMKTDPKLVLPDPNAVPVGPGCATCKRSVADLMSQGHAVGCPGRPGP
jgi:hypothetical protein